MAFGDASGKVIDFRARSTFGKKARHAEASNGMATGVPGQRRGPMDRGARSPVARRVWFACLVLLASLALPLLFARFGDYQPLAQAVATPVRNIAAWSSPGRSGDALPQGKGISVSFTFCGSGIRRNCVVDGDTFWLNGEKIRIADIDTPELSPPRCDREKVKGEAAKRVLLSELNAGGFELVSYGSRDADRYGRKLRTVVRHDRSIGDILIAKGLARPWTGSRSSWCD